MRNVALKLLGAAGVVALISMSAQAADLPAAPPAYEPAPAYVPEYNWTGLYVGAHAGYGWSDTDVSAEVSVFDRPIFGAEDEIDGDGALAGVQVGYNYQTGNFVIGAEADIAWSGIESEAGYGLGPFAAEVNQDVNWLSTVRARAGVTVDRFLVYATAGVAFADVESSIETNFGYSYSKDDTRVGWTAGAGVEAFITPNVTAKLEYLYVDLGDEDHDLFNAGGLEITGNDDLTAHIVRGGINYKFSW